MDSALYQMSINSKIKYFQQLISSTLTSLYYWVEPGLGKLGIIYLNRILGVELSSSKMQDNYPKLIDLSDVMTISFSSSQRNL